MIDCLNDFKKCTICNNTKTWHVYVSIMSVSVFFFFSTGAGMYNKFPWPINFVLSFNENLFDNFLIDNYWKWLHNNNVSYILHGTVDHEIIIKRLGMVEQWVGTVCKNTIIVFWEYSLWMRCFFIDYIVVPSLPTIDPLNFSNYFMTSRAPGTAVALSLETIRHAVLAVTQLKLSAISYLNGSFVMT